MSPCCTCDGVSSVARVWRVIAQQTTTKYNRMFFVDTAKNIYTRCILIFTHKTCTDVYKATGDNCILLSFPTIRIALQFGYQIISYRVVITYKREFELDIVNDGFFPYYNTFWMTCPIANETQALERLLVDHVSMQKIPKIVDEYPSRMLV
ncbi:hypothetical protein EDC94DRAFT_590708 [Helicostylum pulchrum]|nr:hypothetical protein EDC94DRAFT_590708 [Helicostylum pulchrum]